MPTWQGLNKPLGSKTKKETKSGVPVINDEGSMASCLREKRKSVALDVLV